MAKDWEAWVAVSLEPVTRQVLVLGLAPTEAESRKHHDRAGDVPYRKSFNVDDSLGPQLFAWFRACGVPSSEATETVREFGRTLGDLLCDPHRAARPLKG